MRDRRMLLILLVVGLAIATTTVRAHDLHVAVSRGQQVVVLHASYADSGPVPFSAVKVSAPGTPPVEFQSGHADATGRFAFVPDRAGDWRVVVDDELGHRREVVVPIADSDLSGRTEVAGAATGGSSSPGPRALPVPLGIMVGVSLIFGVTGILYGVTARRQSAR